MAYLFKFYHNIGTFPKSNKKITNTVAILFTFLVTGTPIKSGVVKLILGS
jgi:hypothetical protein